MDGAVCEEDAVGPEADGAGEAGAGSAADPREIAGGEPREADAGGGGESGADEWEGSASQAGVGLADAVGSVGKRADAWEAGLGGSADEADLVGPLTDDATEISSPVMS